MDSNYLNEPNVKHINVFILIWGGSSWHPIKLHDMSSNRNAWPLCKTNL